MKKYIKRTLFILVLALCTISVIRITRVRESKLEYHFSNNQDSIAVPIDFFIGGGFLKTKVIVGKDTLDFIVDTGAARSCIDDDFTKKYSAKEVRLERDITEESRSLSSVVLPSLLWGDLAIRDILVISTDLSHLGIDGIIGMDIMKYFFVKIDNENRKIVLCKEPRAVEDYDMELPISFESKIPAVSLEVNIEGKREEQKILFDTGASYTELRLGKNTADCCNKGEIWEESPGGLHKKSSGYSTELKNCVSKLYLGNKCIENVVAEIDFNTSWNLLGSVFLKRFSAVAFDFPNQKVYFKFPDIPQVVSQSGEKEYNFGGKFPICFSKDTITSMPVASMSLLYRKINSMGIWFAKGKDYFKVGGVSRGYKDIVHIRDTLRGIDNVLFENDLLCKKENRGKLEVITERKEQGRIFRQKYYTQKPVRFWFTHNGELYSVVTQRKKILPNPPVVAYEVNSNGDHNAGNYYKLKLLDIHGSKLSLYYPHRELVNEDVAIEVKHNGKIDTLRN